MQRALLNLILNAARAIHISADAALLRAAGPTMKYLTLVVLVVVIAALFAATSGCVYQTGGGGQNSSQNSSQNATHVSIRLPVLPNLSGNTTHGLLPSVSQRLGMS